VEPSSTGNTPLRGTLCKIACEILAARDDDRRDFAHAVCSLRTRQRAQNRP